MRKTLIALGVFGVAAAAIYVAPSLKMGPQPDGTFIVATGQRVEPGTIAFAGRPIDIALHPGGQFAAVLHSRA